MDAVAEKANLTRTGGSSLCPRAADSLAIHERALDITGQIAIVGFDEMPWAISLRPPLTAVAAPAFEVGRTAAESLLDHIQKPLMPRRQVGLETRLIFSLDKLRPIG
jgi:DNA-binding LacI/PurR family transcriptional regulator